MNSSLPSTNQSKKSERFKRLLRRVGQAVIDIHRVPFYFVLAAVLTFVVECLSRRSLVGTLQFMITSPLAYLTNYGIILLTVLPALLFRKRLAGMVFLAAIWTVLGVAQCIVLLSRVTPLAAIDIMIVLSVITIIGAYLTPFQIVLICVGLVALVVGIVLLFVRTRKHAVNWKCFAIVYPATLLATVLIIITGFATGQLSDRFPNLANAYNDYGFPYCFGLSVVDRGVDRPDNYNEDLINAILDGMPEESATPPTADGEKSPNVIIVQLESFFDVKYIEGATYSADPIPTFTTLKEQYPSGYMTVPVIGAGTVNTEFEVLTGMSVIDFGAGEYPFRTIMKRETCETIAYDLLASGYRTHAIHNHEGSFYLRNEVYPNVGFETFTSIEYFNDPTFNENDWAHDALLTDEILHILSSTEESDFVFAVSVQGHGKYPDEYTPYDGDVVVTGGMEEDMVRSHFNYYISQLNEMDVFISELYEAVMAMEEDTVLVLYGDHLPNIVHDEGISVSTGDFTTEYIIIANYETPNTPAGDDLYAYQLFPTVMETIGNDTGVMNRFHRTYRNHRNYDTMLMAMEYDSLYGHRYAYGDKTYPPMDMVMGNRPITITDVYIEGDYLYVKGENFTEYSKIALDGRWKKSQFVDKNTLRLRDRNPTRLLKRADEITIHQLSQTNELLSESAPYTGHKKERTP